MTKGKGKVAIIGAGMAGLTCAGRLTAKGLDVTLFDKGRGPGGRMSTRRTATSLGETAFDHGAQYITARDPDFQQQIAQWEADAIVARWLVAGDDAYVGTPGMNAPVKAMASQQQVHWGTRIAQMEQRDQGWVLASKGREHGPYESVVIALPAEQVGDLLASHHATFAATAAAVHSAPCWTVMLAFDAPLAGLPDTMRDASPIGWAARNSAKPGRRAAIESWVIQGDPRWSTQHLDAEKGDIIAMLGTALAQAGNIPLPTPLLANAHRWRYAMVPKPDADNAPCLWDAEKRIGLCGDWLSGPRVENAWLSGVALGTAI
ncbi:MAG: FAD-dependent oxidoreductase [Pseudomonadota bacterium]